MSVNSESLIPSQKRRRTKFINFVFERAMCSGVTEDSKSFKRISITSNLSLKLKGPVAGKELKTEEMLSKTNTNYVLNEYCNSSVINISDQQINSTENDSQSITSYEGLDREDLISLLLNKNLKLGNFRGIFDIIISPNNLSMA